MAAGAKGKDFPGALRDILVAIAQAKVLPDADQQLLAGLEQQVLGAIHPAGAGGPMAGGAGGPSTPPAGVMSGGRMSPDLVGAIRGQFPAEGQELAGLGLEPGAQQ